METTLMKKYIAFVVLVVSLSVSGGLWAADDSNRIRVDGDKLSVRAEGIALGELLMVVEDMTGIRFKFDESVTKKKVYLDFEGLPLSEGIRKIVYPLNFATIYDNTEKLCKVIILGRWTGSPPISPQKEENDSLEGLKPGSSNEISFTPKGNSESPVASKEPSLEKRSSHFQGLSTSEAPSVDGPTNSREQAMDGPPVGKAYSMEGPPNTQYQTSEGPPNVVSSDQPTQPDSEDSQMEGPPLDKPYSVDGPPDSGDHPLEGPPGAGDFKR